MKESAEHYITLQHFPYFLKIKVGKETKNKTPEPFQPRVCVKQKQYQHDTPCLLISNMQFVFRNSLFWSKYDCIYRGDWSNSSFLHNSNLQQNTEVMSKVKPNLKNVSDVNGIE